VWGKKKGKRGKSKMSGITDEVADVLVSVGGDGADLGDLSRGGNGLGDLLQVLFGRTREEEKR